jgi:hypothetical protein
MQLSPLSVASSVGSTSVVNKADTHSPALAGNQASVERSGESSPDRDAQGQADGLAHRGQPARKPAVPSPSKADAVLQPAPTLPDEPPSQLDLIG